ncbi:MAG: hypothetical protein AB8B91_04290 [Rubripirellula sp.]
MNRWLLIGSLAALLVGSTGCVSGTCGLGGGCSSGTCSSGGCSSGSCSSGSSECASGNCGSGILGKMCNSGGGCSDGSCGGGGGRVRGALSRVGGLCGLCGSGSCRGGCSPGGLGWQQGGHDYSSHLQPGLLGHNAAANLNSRPFTPGPPTGQVGYPYYTHHGPRDFLMSNPPTIGR